jgi:hypothetical protein
MIMICDLSDKDEIMKNDDTYLWLEPLIGCKIWFKMIGFALVESPKWFLKGDGGGTC